LCEDINSLEEGVVRHLPEIYKEFVSVFEAKEADKLPPHHPYLL
jgi:hypothetical protein